MKSNTFTPKDASKYTFAIVRARFNVRATEGLLEGAYKALKESGASESQVKTYEVPGSYDIPYGVQVATRGENPDAIISLGVIIKGETNHDEHIATAVFSELHRLEAEYKLPITLGIITTNTLEQARARSGDDDANVGYQAAHAAVELLYLK